MNGAELHAFINKINSLKPLFLGIFSINTLPTEIPVNHFLICNFDLDHNPGSHWFCLFRINSKKIECFDSLGISKSKKKVLKKYLKLDNVMLKFNNTSVQSLHTSTCGKFVLFFAIHRSHNLDISFTKLLNEIFVEKNEQNELIVGNFLENF